MEGKISLGELRRLVLAINPCKLNLISVFIVLVIGLGKKNVSIPGSLYDSLKERCEGTGFGSVDEYVEYVLREVVEEEEEDEEEFSEEDEEKVKERLRALGYMS